MAETLNSSVCHHLQNEQWRDYFFHRNTWNQTLHTTLFYNVFFNSAFAASVAIFLSTSELPKNTEIRDLSTNP